MQSIIRQAAGTASPAEDKNQQIYTLLTSTTPQTPQASTLSAFSEVGVLTLVPVVLWCLLSWALSYAGSIDLLAKFQLFAFLPAAAAAFACERIRQLRTLPAQLTGLKEENEWFKNSNAELKQGVDQLRSENDETRMANQKLTQSIHGLESVRTAIETYATRHETDFAQVLSDFQRSVQEQQLILQRTRVIQRRTRKLTEAQWRALMLNLFAQVEYHDGERGMTREEFDLWLAMLPVEIADKLSPETFENIDSNGDDIIDAKEMCEWVQTAVKTILCVDDSESGAEDSDEVTDAADDRTQQFSVSLPSAKGSHGRGSAQSQFCSSGCSSFDMGGALGSLGALGALAAGTTTRPADRSPASPSGPATRPPSRDSVGRPPSRDSVGGLELGPRKTLAETLAVQSPGISPQRKSGGDPRRLAAASTRRPSFNQSYMQVLFGEKRGPTSPAPATDSSGSPPARELQGIAVG